MLIDFEGYQVANRFFFKEFTYCNINENSFCNLFIKTPIIRHNKTINWLIQSHHRIPMEYGSINYKRVIKTLNNASIIYCKGKSKVDILEKLTNNIIIDIELFGCPKYVYTHSNQLVCEFHNNNPHCALNKAYFYYKWLKQYER
jgi:hypothetical protein